MFRVRMVHMDRIVVKTANAKMVPGAERTMDTASVTKDGWEIIVMMCARKDSTENIVWNSVRVRHLNSSVMQRVDASAVWVMMVSIV